MANTDIVVGLDIGTTKIAVVVGRENENGKIEILGFGTSESIGVKRGFVSNIEQTIESILKAVKKAEDVYGQKISVVQVGIAGQFIKSIQQYGSLIRKNLDDEISQDDITMMTENMHSLIMNPGEEIIDIIPQEYTIDGEAGVINPIGMAGISIETYFHIITAQASAIRNISKCVMRAGLTLDNLILEPIASAEAVLSEEEKEAGVVLVDIGGGMTDIAIFHNGIIRHTAVIPFGGEIITEDIKEGCTIIKKYAEDLKVKFGSVLSNAGEDEIVSIPGLRGRPHKEISIKNLSSIIQARMEEILEQVDTEIANSEYGKKLIAGIVLTGGGSLLKHIKQLTEFVTGLDTRIGYPNEYLAPNTDKELDNPIYSTAIGLVKKGIMEQKLKQKKNEVKPEAVSEEASVEEPMPENPEQPRKTPFFERFGRGVMNWFSSQFNDENE